MLVRLLSYVSCVLILARKVRGASPYSENLTCRVDFGAFSCSRACTYTKPKSVLVLISFIKSSFLGLPKQGSMARKARGVVEKGGKKGKIGKIEKLIF